MPFPLEKSLQKCKISPIFRKNRPKKAKKSGSQPYFPPRCLSCCPLIRQIALKSSQFDIPIFYLIEFWKEVKRKIEEYSREFRPKKTISGRSVRPAVLIWAFQAFGSPSSCLSCVIICLFCPVFVRVACFCSCWDIRRLEVREYFGLFSAVLGLSGWSCSAAVVVESLQVMSGCRCSAWLWLQVGYISVIGWGYSWVVSYRF